MTQKKQLTMMEVAEVHHQSHHEREEAMEKQIHDLWAECESWKRSAMGYKKAVHEGLDMAEWVIAADGQMPNDIKARGVALEYIRKYNFQPFELPEP